MRARSSAMTGPGTDIGMSSVSRSAHDGSQFVPVMVWESTTRFVSTELMATAETLRAHPSLVAYLDKLNPEQRRAVEHGVRAKECTPAGPLLVIAGAGS